MTDDADPEDTPNSPQAGDADAPPAVDPGDHDPANPATVTCQQCDREWDLAPEMEAVGNSAVEQFALDHQRHTGHFPDGIATWRARCRQCPEGAERIEETAARRWARTHARHTTHAVDLVGAEEEYVVE